VTTDLRGQLQELLGERYTLDRELGGGGMSRVFIATESALGRKVVIKVLPPEVGAEVRVERFNREIQFLARLNHPHIVPLLAAGGADDLSYYVMPYMQGESLRTRIIQYGELPVAQVVRTLREVASALAFAHNSGIVHRDIKPDNVLLVGGSAMVTDFGVAKALSVSTVHGDPNSLTSLGIALGTPSYMAPEQAMADPNTDHRADLYSFGAMAYEMLSGQTPFISRSPHAMLAAHIGETPVPLIERRPTIPASLNSLVMHCLQKSPENRPQTADEIVVLLDGVTLTPAEGVRTHDALAEAVSASSTLPATSLLSRAKASDLYRPKPWLIALGAILIVAFGVVLARGVVSKSHSSDADPNMGRVARTKSIAVLPLVNVTGDPQNEYFSDGMSDEIMGALSKVPGLRVASRTSAFAFKGKRLDAREIGRRLNVGVLLEGSVRREGEQLRVNVQLTNVADNLAIWSETYARRMKDVFSVQDSISQAIVAALSLKLSGKDSARMTQRGTEQVDAFDLYLKGHFFVNKNTEPDIRKGLGFYEQALAEDPNYARAWAGVAYAWIALADDYVAPRDAYPRAKKAALNALRIDSTLAEARAALGAVNLWYDWDTRAAALELREAIRLDPNGVYAYRYYGNLLKGQGKFDSAMTVIRRAQQLEPLSPGRTTSVALMYTTLGKYDLAMQEARSALEIDPNYADAFLAIGNALLAEHKAKEAIAEFSLAPKMGNRMQSGIASAEAALGHRDGALGIVRSLVAESKQHYIGPEAIAAVYVALGDRDRAFEWLEKAYQARSAYMVLLRSDRRWDSVRADPRFAVLLKKVGV
jgi:serine/threonine protein kinase/tetratricopeptide (TPR) repeat protein